MKTPMNSRMLQLALLGMLALLSPTPSVNAQSLQGSFDLPVAAQWGLAKLPAGHYSFALYDSASPYVIHVEGKKASAVIMASGGMDLSSGGQQKINLIKTSKGWAVSSFNLPEVGMVLNYRTHGTSKALMAKNTASRRGPFPSQGK